MHFIRSVPSPVISPQSVVVLGDSLTEQGGLLSNGSSPLIKPTSYWTHANVLMGWRFRILHNAGIFGQTTTQILRRLEQDAISYNPGWVWLLAGTNDVGQGILQTTTFPNLQRILDRLEQANIRVAWLTIPPRAGTYTGTQLADTLALNDWIRQEARRRPNVVLADIWQPLAGQTLNYLATVYGRNPTSDGIHMSGAGGFAAGQVLANVLTPLTHPADPFGFNTTSGTPGLNMLGDPRFASGTGTSAPTSYTLNNTPAGVAWSKTARSDANGNWQTVTVPAGSTSVFSIQGNGGADRSGRNAPAFVGRQVTGTFEFSVTGLDQAAAAGSQGIYGSIGFYNGSSFTHVYSMQDSSGPWASRAGRIVIAPTTVPAGTTVISLFMWLLGGGTFNIDKAGLYNADQTGILIP